MNLRQIIFSVFFLVPFLSYSQQQGGQGVNKLNIEKYKPYWEGKTARFVKNDTVYRLEVIDDYYLESKNRLGSRLIWYASYEMQCLKLLSDGQQFSEIPVGEHREYNALGKVVARRYFDNDFPFTLEDLISKAKKELDLDLNDEKYTVRRYKDEEKAAYFIRYELGHRASQFIKIDGVTGEVIFNKVTFFQE